MHDAKRDPVLATLHAVVGHEGVEEFRLETSDARYENPRAHDAFYEAILVTMRPSLPAEAWFDTCELKAFTEDRPAARIRLACYVFVDWRATVEWQAIEDYSDMSESDAAKVWSRTFGLLALRIMERSEHREAS